MLNKVITGDKTWVYVYDPETKPQSPIGRVLNHYGSKNKAVKVQNQVHVESFFLKSEHQVHFLKSETWSIMSKANVAESFYKQAD